MVSNDDSNRQNIAKLENTLRLRIERKGARGMYITTEEAEKFAEYCVTLRREALDVYAEISTVMSPEIRKRIDSLSSREDNLKKMLCYVPGLLQQGVKQAYDTATAKEEDVDVFHLLRVLGLHF